MKYPFLFLALALPLVAAERPNIVLIMADDIGVECLSCYGGESHKTPNLDALAASGMRFENAHSQPICTPSRVQIMTGIHNNRNYVRFRGRDCKGGKGSPKDNGTHVGFIASWPGVIEKGQVSESLVDFTDVLPTLTEVAGAKAPEGIDGVSLAPLFRGQPREKDHIYCWYSRDGVRKAASQHVRDARHKLYAGGGFYDTVADPDEKNDLASGGIPEPLQEKHGRLKAALERHLTVTSMADPVQETRRAALKRDR